MGAIDIVKSDEFRRHYIFRLSLKHNWLKKRKRISSTVSGNGITVEDAERQFMETVKIPRNYHATTLSVTIRIG